LLSGEPGIGKSRLTVAFEEQLLHEPYARVRYFCSPHHTDSALPSDPRHLLTDRSVANIVKAYAERAGFDASTFSGHSLRASFLTSAAAKGASIFKMMDVSRHKSYAQNSGRPCMKGGPQRECLLGKRSLLTTSSRAFMLSYSLFNRRPIRPEMRAHESESAEEDTRYRRA